MAGIVLAVLLAFGIGAYAGQEKTQEQADVLAAGKVSTSSHILPEKGDTLDRMIQCRAFCGDERTQSYDSLTGMCKCVNPEHVYLPRRD